MLARQRQEPILDEMRETVGVRVSGLVERLGVPDMTVRRDIDAPAARGLVTRVHGGATAAGSSVDEPGFTAKAGPRTAAKTVVLTGGERTPSDALAGPVAVAALSRLHVTGC